MALSSVCVIGNALGLRRVELKARRRHILTVMIRRLAALVLALVVTGAPASLIACEILCAARADRASHSDAAAPHSCHATQPAGTAAAVTTGVHVCGHGEELPATTAKVVPQAAPAPGDAIAAVPFLLHTGVSHRFLTAASLPPGPSKLLTPLRI